MTYMSFKRCIGYHGTLQYTNKEIQKYEKEYSRHFKYLDKHDYFQYKKNAKKYAPEEHVLTKTELIDLFKWKIKHKL